MRRCAVLAEQTRDFNFPSRAFGGKISDTSPVVLIGQ
jgi:hypothetical protein